MTDTDYLVNEVNNLAEQNSGEDLRNEVESFLDELGVNHSVEGVGGLEQPEHKSYTYELELDGERYQAELVTIDGRPGTDNWRFRIYED